jgi:hypothetical protein
MVITSRNMTLVAHANEALDALAVIEAPTDETAQAPWFALMRTEAFQRLHQREAAMGRDFTDSSFRAFLRSPNTGDIATSLSAGAFINQIAHELHHVGYATACKGKSDTIQAEPLKTVVNWMGAFGEGWAMLAAAGGPNVHPHATSDSATRARWDHDFADAAAQLRELEHFFQDVLDKRLTSPDSIQQTAMSFFGVQGPWYTVGYLMARTIETTFGRPRLVSVWCDPVALTREYQRAAREVNAAGGALPLWSEQVLRRLGP